MMGVTLEKAPTGRAQCHAGRHCDCPSGLVPKGEWRITTLGSGWFGSSFKLDCWLRANGGRFLKELIFEALSVEQLTELGLEVAGQFDIATSLLPGDVLRLLSVEPEWRTHRIGGLYVFIRYDIDGSQGARIRVRRMNGVAPNRLFLHRFEFVERPVK